MSLLSGNSLQLELAKLISRAQSELILVSAYVTLPAIEWAIDNIKPSVSSKIICRFQPSDILNGSTDINALILAKQEDWGVYFLPSLHAKIYMQDCNRIIVGSANCTSNGLKLYGSGNLEACVEKTADTDDIAFVYNILNQSTEINEDQLKEIKEHVKTDNFANRNSDVWPTDIFPSTKGIWVSDFFFETVEHRLSNNHDLQILPKNIPTLEELKNHLLKCRCVDWLINTIEQEIEKEIYFGCLTRRLHNEILDDPTPYRTDIKTLISNLLNYCEVYLQDIIKIDRPNYSQRISLRDYL